MSSMQRRRAVVQSIAVPPSLRGSLPRNMFSMIDSSGISASSWWMITMPTASDSPMLRNWHSSPL